MNLPAADVDSSVVNQQSDGQQPGALFPAPVSALSGAQAGGGDDHGLVAGDVAHGDEGEDGGADGEEAGNGEEGVFSELGVPLEEVHCQDYLVCDEYECVEVAQTDLADAVFERYEGDDTEHRAYQLEDGGEGKALECRYFYEADDGVLSDEADHGCEEHGDKQSGCYGQEEALYSEKHIDVDFMGLQAQK